LTDPLIKENGEFREASWDEALDWWPKSSKIKDTHGGDSIGVLDFGPHHQRRELHRPQVCPGGAQDQQHRSLRPSLTQLHRGRSGRSIRKWRHDKHIADIEEADVILITGSNTTENHPVLSTFVKRAVTRQRAPS
jgi:formate dehydrogenase alpha subunit